MKRWIGLLLVVFMISQQTSAQERSSVSLDVEHVIFDLPDMAACHKQIRPSSTQIIVSSGCNPHMEIASQLSIRG